MQLADDITSEDLKVFLEEAEEQLQLLDDEVIRLEKETTEEGLAGIFNSLIEGGSNIVPCPLPEGAFKPLQTSIDLSLFEARNDLQLQRAA
jgi:hypothetical protein